MLRSQGILVKATAAIFFPTLQLFSQIFLTQSESSTSLSKFHSFHETKPTQNEVVRLFYNLAEFVFEHLYDIRINLVCPPDLTWYFITIHFVLHNLCVAIIRCAVASRLVRSIPDRALRVQAL